MTPQVLTRVRDVPSRALAAALTFGAVLGLPTLFGLIAGLLFAAGLEIGGVICVLLSVVSLAGAAVLAWVLLFQARTRLKRAEQALYAGDYETATRNAQFVLRAVFRADYQMGALFTLALAAERLGAFNEAGALFRRALAMIPMMAAPRPLRRARALLTAHAAIDLAAANDLAGADAMLAQCWAALGAAGQPGAFDALFDDSYMGAVGINSMLVELENRREPRPLAVLATAVVAYKRGRTHDALQLLNGEHATLAHGLAANEMQLAERLHAESFRHTTQAGPHRSAGALTTAAPTSGWAELVVPPTR